ncbi:MAG: CRTAC1 family protein [Gemmataceae bacterium]
MRCAWYWLGALCCLWAVVVAAAAAPLFRFADVTTEAGLTPARVGLYNHAVAWGDFDGDGLPDLFLGNFADKGFDATLGQRQPVPNLLFRQVAGGKFEHFPCPAVERPARCSGAVFVDLNNDGNLDLYVSSNKLEKSRPGTPGAEGCRLYRNDGGGKFVDISESCGACPPTLYRCRDIAVLDYDKDGLLDLLVIQDRVVRQDGKVFGSRLFRNLGNHRFEDVTHTVGLPEDLWGAGVAVGDVNGDQRPDIFVAYSNRLFLSQPDGTYREAESLRSVFDHQPADAEDIVVGAAFGDIDNDGDLDLITGTHYNHGLSRVHVFLNEGVQAGVPRFREVTRELGIPPLPMKAPHPEIQDFDNDGWPDLYWSAWFAEGAKRRPFLCRGLGVRDGLPRFAVPSVEMVRITKKDKLILNTAPPEGLGMVYYVDGPAVDYDADGRLDFFGGSWPNESSRLFRNETKAGNWLQVQVQGKKMNRMGVGAVVRLYPAGKAGDRTALWGHREITVNGGYSSGRPAVAHFGLGTAGGCDVEVILPSQAEPVVVTSARANQRLLVREP